MKIVMILLSTLLVSACSTTGNKGASIGSEAGKVCKMEAKTGTRIVARVCKTPKQMAEEERLAEQVMRDLNRGGSVTSK